jgi:hypothetical protein
MDSSDNKIRAGVAMNFDDALSISDLAFLSLHPRETWPEGLAACVTRGGSLDQQGQWVMSYTAAQKEPLKPGEYWDTIKGQRVLCKTDPKTGAPRVVIHRRSSVPPVVLFQVSIDPRTGKATILVDEDITSLNVEDFERG